MRKLLNIVGVSLFVIALVNFFAFAAIAARMGGDATNGKVEDGRYYVSNHGKLTEVSASVWHYSRTHAVSVWITHPLGLLGMGMSVLTQRRKDTG